MKNAFIGFFVALMTLSAQANQFKQLSMSCKSSSEFISELGLSVQESASSKTTSYLHTLAIVNGNYCNIISSELTAQELAAVTTAKNQMLTKKITLVCNSSNLSNNTLNVVLSVDSSKRSASLTYHSYNSSLETVNMTCTSEGLFERIKDSLRFPDIGS